MRLTIICLLLILVSRPRGDSEGLPSRQAVDLVLDCWYVEEGGGRLTAIGGGFSRDKALLVLRNVSVTEDEQTSTWTDYEVREEDQELIIFEAVVSEVSIPEGELLLHADCEGKEVACEISSFEPPGQAGDGPEDPGSYFMGSLRITGGGLGMAMVMKSLPVTEEERMEQAFSERLNVVLTAAGTVSISVEFLVYTRTPTIRTTLGQGVLLDCSFTGGETAGVSVEWRLQHKGSGRRIYFLAGGEGAAERAGAAMDVEKVEAEGNASLQLDHFTVRDEGTYICIVQGSRGYAQQTILVEVMESPQVRLNPDTMFFREGMRERLTCEIGRYYPLDVTVTWTVEIPGDNLGPRALSGVSFTSHRHNKDGTFNLSASVEVAPGSGEAGAVYACEVSHVSLETPVIKSLRLEHWTGSKEGSQSALYGSLIASILFLLAAMHFCRETPKPAGPPNRAGQETVTAN